MYKYSYVSMFTCTDVNFYKCVDMYIHIHRYAWDMCMYMYIYVYFYMCMCFSIYWKMTVRRSAAHPEKQWFFQKMRGEWTHAHTHARTHAHTHIHTHTLLVSQVREMRSGDTKMRLKKRKIGAGVKKRSRVNAQQHPPLRHTHTNTRILYSFEKTMDSAAGKQQ